MIADALNNRATGRRIAWGLIVVGGVTLAIVDAVAGSGTTPNDGPVVGTEPADRNGMELVVQLRLDAARAIRSGVGLHDKAATASLAGVLERFGVALVPQHPGVEASELATFFTISGVPATETDALRAALLDLDLVTAAYVQPEPSPP